ncbi:disintegrin and metalloproteinase domain-containing protein 22 isoform X1 [Lates japonicus]|uniref:Disintegrin and metalloproteinase domain-containing protein 22 isoform X1 n=1 Tax=Lates japonicus TaxID=270547 RepID=A0AAD3N1N5_LATJO|nr:disintegrin and metalloproteinase domain-containing protein 22 isoform X1 [Lates japonicus]
MMVITGRIGQEWRSCCNLTWRNVEEAGFRYHLNRSGRRKAGLAAFLRPLSAHIYALGVSAVSRWILMCFKEVSPVLSSPPSTPPTLPPSPPLSLTLSPPYLLRAADPRGLGALRRVRRSDS